MCSILILDDDKPITDLLSDWIVELEILNKEHKLVVANSYDDAVCILQQVGDDNLPVLYFVDINLKSEKNGLDFVQYVRERNTRAIVYIVSGSDPVKYKSRIIKLGVAGIFRKPIDFGLLEITLLSELKRTKQMANAIFDISDEQQQLLEDVLVKQENLLKMYDNYIAKVRNDTNNSKLAHIN